MTESENDPETPGGPPEHLSALPGMDLVRRALEEARGAARSQGKEVGRGRRSPAARQDESDKRAPEATTRAAFPATAGDSGPGVAPSPLRSQARVLRLWIKPWEDADGDLYDQGYVYVQVDNGQWLIDHVQRQIRDAYAPLKPPPKSAPDTATESNPGGNSPAAPSLPQRPTVTGPGASRAQ